MKYNMFKGMVHFGWYIDTYISLHIWFKFLLPLGFFSSKPEQDSKGATRCPWSVRTLFAFSTFLFFRIFVDSSTLQNKRGKDDTLKVNIGKRAFKCMILN